jgi:hypothetical protein
LWIALLCLWKLQLLLGWHETSVISAETSSWENNVERLMTKEHAGLT